MTAAGDVFPFVPVSCKPGYTPKQLEQTVNEIPSFVTTCTASTFNATSLITCDDKMMNNCGGCVWEMDQYS